MASTNRTIQDMIDGGYSITAYCHNTRCGHHAVIDLRMTRERLGPDHGAMHDDLVPKLRCARCGGEQIGLIVTPGSKEHGVNAYQKAKAGR